LFKEKFPIQFQIDTKLKIVSNVNKKRNLVVIWKISFKLILLKRVQMPYDEIYYQRLNDKQKKKTIPTLISYAS